MSNYRDNEIQRIFDEADRKAEEWQMPNHTRMASIDNLTENLLNELDQELDSDSDDESKEIPEIMTSEEIEALIKNNPSSNMEPMQETADLKQTPGSESDQALNSENDEKLTPSQIEQMFEQQSSSISKPETEEDSDSQVESEQEVSGDGQIETSMQKDANAESETDSEPGVDSEVETDSEPGVDSEVDKNTEIPENSRSFDAAETTDLEPNSEDEVGTQTFDSQLGVPSEENPNQSESSETDRLYSQTDHATQIRQKKIEQQSARSEIGEIDVAALFKKKIDKALEDVEDPTAVLSQDNFRENIQIVDNQSNVIDSDHVLGGLLNKKQANLRAKASDDGILSNEEVSEMLQGNNVDETSSRAKNPFDSEHSSLAESEFSEEMNSQQFALANEVEKGQSMQKFKKWIMRLAMGILLALAIAGVILFPQIKQHWQTKAEEFVNPSASWSWEKNTDSTSSVKYKIFTSGMSLMLSNINGAVSSDINKLNTDMIKQIYETQIKQKKLNNFKMLNETRYMREAGDSLRMIHFDYAIKTSDNRSFLKKSVYLGVGERLLKLDFTARTDNIDESSDGPNWSRLESNFRAALGLGELNKDKEVYLGENYVNFEKSSGYFASRALGLNP